MVFRANERIDNNNVGDPSVEFCTAFSIICRMHISILFSDVEQGWVPD